MTMTLNSDARLSQFVVRFFGWTDSRFLRTSAPQSFVLAMTALVSACANTAHVEPRAPSEHDVSSNSAAIESSATGGQTEESSGKNLGSLPDFELETLDGESVRLSEHLGKSVILIDFWATYCAPCLLAMPHLNQLYEKHKDDGFIVLGVSVDGPESMARVRSDVRRMGITFPILLDIETEALALYNPNASAPYSILIDRQGNIVKKKEGFSPNDVPLLEQAVVDALQ